MRRWIPWTAAGAGVIALGLGVASIALWRAPARSPVKTVSDCALICPAMVSLPGGVFAMGSPSTDAGRDDDEGPVHRVRVRPFLLAQAPVTFQQFAAFVRETGYDAGLRWRDPGFAQKPLEPVVGVAFADAQAYIAWLSKRTGHAYRLPTEAEYEYAERAGTVTEFWWGGDQSQTSRHGNAVMPDAELVIGPIAVVYPRDTFAQPSVVGQYGYNPWGLADMAGNVWEWTQDCYAPSYVGAPADGSAREPAGDCPQRVIRGGAWNSLAVDLRSASRSAQPPTQRAPDTGFRVARSL